THAILTFELMQRVYITKKPERTTPANSDFLLIDTDLMDLLICEVSSYNRTLHSLTVSIKCDCQVTYLKA
uniref:Uncharacterized protein n=2 Tax=Aegilops tauschii subsp. strangulata TaxID=200361 RepID=A0A452YR00_AEGTS